MTKSREFTEHEAVGGLAFQALLELWRADRDKATPDPAAVAFIAQAFRRWMQAGGAVSLEEVMGLTADGKGRATMMDEFNRNLRDVWYRHLVAVLLPAGFSVEEAAEAVAEHQERNQDHLRKLHQKPLKAKSVRDVFMRMDGVEWARQNNYFGAADEVLEGSITREDERKSLISLLAPHLIPPAARK